MRVSTQATFLTGLTAMQRLQAALDQTQRQISSGRRVLVPSDDPIAAGRALELRESLSRLQQFDRNAGIAENRLSQEETTLNSVNNVLQRVRELALQANNSTQSDETRQLIAVEMRDRLDFLVQLANQRDGSGQYLFSGNLTETAPVSRSGAGYAYNGDQGQRFIRIGEGREIAGNDAGSEVFFRIRAGNGVFTTRVDAANAGTGVVGQTSVTDPTAWDNGDYTVNFIDAGNYEVVDSGGAAIVGSAWQSGDPIAFLGVEVVLTGQPAAGDSFNVTPAPYQDMFTTIDRLVTALEQPVTDDPSRAGMTNAINAALGDLDQAIGNVLDVRTRIGSRLSAIENQVDNNGAMALATQETIAEIEDLDYAEAISRLSLQVSTLEAAQQSFVRTQQLSLFNFL